MTKPDNLLPRPTLSAREETIRAMLRTPKRLYVLQLGVVGRSIEVVK